MVSQQLVDIIIKAQDQASSTAEKVDSSLRKIGDSSSRLSKIPGFDAMKSKLSGVATAIDGKLGGALTKAREKFNTFKNSVTSAASTVKGKLGGALDGIRNKLSSVSNGAKGLQSAMGFLKGAVSMTAGMIGYDLFNSLMQTTKASLNARSSMQAFAGRLKMSGQEVQEFQKSLDEMQNVYKKIDMDVVGQQSTDLAYRLGLPKESLTELTETTAIFTDAMQRNGRSAEDSMLAMSDAMDGQFVRLKEIGISQEDLMRNGWSGDLNDKKGLLDAMNKSLKEQHYDDLAKSVDTLDDAWQVLSITLSNFLEAILLPLTPVIVQIVTGLTDAVNAIKPFIQTLQSAAGALPDWLKDAGWAIAFAVAIGIVAQYIWFTLIPALAAAATEAWAFAAAMLANPFTWVVIALVAIAYAVYEVGKAFGWWTDVQSMLEAVWAGLQRMWNAFINHPDVQAAISAISSALSTLWDWIQQAGQAVMEFFNINQSGSFDIVRALIDGIGLAWKVMGAHIRLAIGIIQGAIGICGQIAEAISTFWNETLVPFGEWLNGIFGPAWSTLSEALSYILPYVEQLVTAFNDFKNGQLDLPGVIFTVISILWNAWNSFVTTMGSLFLTFAANLFSWAWSAGSNIVRGIVTWLSQLPGRVLSWLGQTGNVIGNNLSRWVTTARLRMMVFVTSIITRLSSLPGQVYAKLMAVVGRIVSAIQSWVNAARQKAQDIVNGVGSALSGTASAVSNALSGVKDAVIKPFQDAYNSAKQIWDNIASLANNIPGVGNNRGGEGYVAGGEDWPISNYSTGNGKVEVEQTITLDFKNVPSQIDTNTLIDALSDRNVIQALVGNRTFQDLDAKVKQQIILKGNRARGV